MSVSILVVDDEPGCRRIVPPALSPRVREGACVMQFANSAEAALQQLADGIQPALIVILSDINMPGMDGLQLLGEIKQGFPELPVMMVTAYGDDEHHRQARDLGACEFLSKPVDSDLLKTELRRLPTGAG
jgi:CheY-like chemotaxis protein